MTLNCNRRLAYALLLFTALPVWAQEGQESESTRIDQTRLEQSSQRAAEAWGLNQQEYRRYESIMEGPRGTWSPDLDPLTALGLEARSQAERQKYAEKLVETEVQFQYVANYASQRGVGGAVDVASITKENGFMWVKRKDTFDPALNPRTHHNPRESAEHI